MKIIKLLSLIATCVMISSCSGHDLKQAGPPAPPSPPPNATASVHDNVAGGFSKPEPGETESTEFKGTAGVTEKKRSDMAPVLLKAVRTGNHQSFDRVVFEFEGSALPGYLIEYVDKPIRDCGQGAVVPISGDGFLMIQLQPANAHTEAGQPSVQNRQQNPGLPVLKELKQICDFEAQVQWISGLSSPNRYRVLELKNPARLVVDIAHQKSSQ